jgi:hypothetical protein
MRKKSSFILICVLVLVAAALAWGAGGMLWNWLLAMHGKH